MLLQKVQQFLLIRIHSDQAAAQEYIHARTAVPALCDAVEGLAAEVGRVTTTLDAEQEGHRATIQLYGPAVATEHAARVAAEVECARLRGALRTLAEWSCPMADHRRDECPDADGCGDCKHNDLVSAALSSPSPSAARGEAILAVVEALRRLCSAADDMEAGCELCGREMDQPHAARCRVASAQDALATLDAGKEGGR